MLVHSDQGSQFTSMDWTSFLAHHNLVHSMSRRGNCDDNAVAESFFNLLKRERIRRRTYRTRDEARQDVFDYIEMFYNPTASTPETACSHPSTSRTGTNHELKGVYETRGYSQQGQSMKAEVSQIDRKIEQMVNRLVETNSEAAIKAYERTSGDLETERAVLREKIENCGKPIRDYDEVFEHPMQFLSSPWKIWEKGNMEYRHTVLKLAFDDRLAYCRDTGV